MKHDALIIGAGISGLICARSLKEHGLNVALIDKGRGVGGRMATRRIGHAVFDHGAQFFTARSEDFQGLIQRAIDHKAVTVWSRGFSNAIGLSFADGHPRYRGKAGMTSLPKALAENMDVLVGERILDITFDENGWNVITESDLHFVADALVMTPPVPQTLELLEQNKIEIAPEIHTKLQSVEYDRCIALMIRLARATRIPRPGAYNLNSEPIAWLTDNHVKGISPERGALTIHLGPESSRAYWESDENDLLDVVVKALPQLDLSNPKEIQVQRWRYSKPRQMLAEKSLFSPIPGPIIFAGDAFSEPRVEGAALSGSDAARVLLHSSS